MMNKKFTLVDKQLFLLSLKPENYLKFLGF